MVARQQVMWRPEERTAMRAMALADSQARRVAQKANQRAGLTVDESAAE